jgi:tripartite ATP-independent transporter DctP family solute receptor
MRGSKMKKNIVFMLILCLVTLAACGNSDKSNSSSGENGDEISFKIGSIVTDTHIISETVMKFKEEIEKKSDGRLTVDYYPNATLGGEAEMLQQTQTGSIDMVWSTTAELSKSADSLSAWFMPYLMKDYDDLYEMAGTEEAMDLYEGLDRVHVLGTFAAGGMRHVLTKDESISTLADFKGQKIRVTPSNAIIEWWKSVGAVPTPVPLPELYTAMQTGVVSAMDIDLDAIISNKYFEIGKNFTSLNHMVWSGSAVVGEQTWNGLSDEDKKIVVESFEVAREFNRDRSVEKEKSNLKAFEENGGIIKEFEEKDQLLNKADEIREKYSSQNEKMKKFIERAEEMNK